jgi:hypothetical protein
MKAAVVACVSITFACEDAREPSRTEEKPEAVIRAPSISIARLVKDPLAYDGHTVRLEGEVDARLGPDLIIVRGHGLLWAPTIPVVVTRASMPRPLLDDDAVAVRGVARAGMTSEDARQLGAATRHRIGDSPYVVAAEIERRR